MNREFTAQVADARLGAVLLDVQECKDIEAWASNFAEVSGSPLPISAEKYAVFKDRGLDMSLFRVKP